MDLLNHIEDIYKYYALFALIYTRIITCLYTITVFRKEMITARVMISLAAGISFILYPQVANVSFDDKAPLFLMMFCQFVIGFALGLTTNFIFEAFQGAGQFISTQIGLSIGSLIDNRIGLITPLTEFYYLLIAILFFMTNGHLMIIEILVRTFHVLPLQSFDLHNVLSASLKESKTIFVVMLLLSAVILMCVLTTNLTIAVLSKFSPQFNVFSIGINIQLILGLFIIYLTFYEIVQYSSLSLHEFLNHIATGFLGGHYVR